VEESAPGFRVWSGDDSMTIPVMSVGGYGIVSVASHLVGKQIQEMIQHFVAGRVSEAAALHRKLLPFFNACFVTTNPIPLKYAMRQVGFDVGSVRLPLVEPEAAQAAVMDAALAAHQIDLPVPVTA
jgi:4-hydroxy-tetrahydrodipicolinate synthase